VPDSPSGKGEACIADLFNFDFKGVGAAVSPTWRTRSPYLYPPGTRWLSPKSRYDLRSVNQCLGVDSMWL
jgi:hypothetical protein